MEQMKKCSRDSEIWFEKALIKKGEAIDDYYLRNHTEYLKPKVKYYDPEWNQEEYNNIFKNKSCRKFIHTYTQHVYFQ